MTQAEQLAAQAAQWQAAGRADMAVQLYGAALEQDPSKFAVRMQLAECLVMLGQADPAAEQYLMVAQAYAGRGRQQECLAICDRVLAIAPHAFVYMTVGPMVRRIGRQARPVCARAAELHLAAGRQTDGLQMLRLGAELDPHNPDVRRQLARIYQGRHMRREAVEALSDAGNLLLQAKRYDDYVEVAEQILALEPRELETLRDLPRVYLELRRPHEAVRTLGQLTKASPGDIVGYEILAQAFAMIGRLDKSLSVLERLVEELGATGQADKADAILNHARYWRPTDVGFLRSLKRMEVPRPATPAERTPARAAAPEGTVVLSIADLLVEEVSKHARAPGKGGDVQLTEAEGTLTLRLDDLLILDELQQAASRGMAPSKPPLGSPPPPPGPRGRLPPPPKGVGTGAGHGWPRAAEAPVESTLALDVGDLIEALTGENAKPPAPKWSDRPDATELLTTETQRPRASDDVPPTLALPLSHDVDDERATMPPRGRSMSELIYDDDDAETDTEQRRDELRRDALRRDEEESDADTLLHMKPLTAQDIARALAKQAAEAEAQAAAPPAPPAAARSRPVPSSSQLDELEVPTRPPPSAWRSSMDDVTTVPPSRAPAGMGDDAPTMFSTSARIGDDLLDERTTVPPSRHSAGPRDDAPLRPPGPGDEALTVAKLSPLTAADIARALSQRTPTRPPMPVREDADPVPPPAMASPEPPPVPQEPPLLPPLPPRAPAAHVDDPDDDDGDEETKRCGPSR